MPGWSPTIWGPHYWSTIHIAALYFDYLYTQNPDDAKTRWRSFLHGITSAVPCAKCEFHFKKFQDDHPPPMESGGMQDPHFLKWTIECHNKVRERTNKFVPKVSDVVQAYQDGRVYQAPSDTVNQTQTRYMISPLKSQVIGWQVGFGAACFVILVLCIWLARSKRKP